MESLCFSSASSSPSSPIYTRRISVRYGEFYKKDNSSNANYRARLQNNIHNILAVIETSLLIPPGFLQNLIDENGKQAEPDEKRNLPETQEGQSAQNRRSRGTGTSYPHSEL